MRRSGWSSWSTTGATQRPTSCSPTTSNSTRRTCDGTRRRNSSTPITSERVEVESEASGKAHCTDAEGKQIEISFSLAPIQPPRIQEYELKKTGV